MAMLAEKRQKVRWVLNPRQTAWSKDSNKFGQQYMEKLGWKAGQGIGANLQGCTEHVKVSVRSDNRGVGFKDVPEDVLPHQNNYSDLLAQLATDNPPAMTVADEGMSLELKSRQSRARVHYHKFTRSKDLSRYSQNDLSCILGKPTKNNKKSSVELSVECETNFIHRGNMKEYFKEKVKSTFTNFISEETDKFKEEEEDSLYIGFGFNQVTQDAPSLCSVSENSDNKEELNGNKKQSRKKHKMNYGGANKPDSYFPRTDCAETEPVQPIEEERELKEKGKKSNRKRKLNGQSVELQENCFVQTDLSETERSIDKDEEFNQSVEMSKKKRKKMDRCVEDLESEDCLLANDNSEMEQPMETEEELNVNIKKSKKKRKNGEYMEVPEIASCLSETQPIETEEESNVNIKKSKKKRKNGEYMEVPEIDSCLPETQPIETEEESNVNIKKSKKKRKNGEYMEVPEIDSCFPETQSIEPEEEPNVNVKKSKKKRKNGEYMEVPEIDSCLPETQPIETEEEPNVNVKKSKKKRKIGEYIEVPEIDSCLPETQPMETEEESNVNIKKSKKKRKNGEYMEVPEAQPVETEEESNVDIKKSKKKRKNGECMEVLSTSIMSTGNDAENISMSEDIVDDISLSIKKNISSNLQPNHEKKKKKKDKCNDSIIDSQSSESLNCMHREVKSIKSVRFSEPLSSVLLIPSRDKLQSELNCDTSYEPESSEISPDLNIKKRNKKSKTKIDQDETNDFSKEADEGNQSTDISENMPDISTPSIIVVDGVTYVNGISEDNINVPRKQKYANSAAKAIPYEWRESILVGKFPGVNVETLQGYGMAFLW